MVDELELQLPSQGWKQFLATRKKLLFDLDQARERSRDHGVQVFHGKVAEASFRVWLADFLPKKYGVTSGRIISPGTRADQTAHHFDVIIYDQLEAPILWIDDNGDSSPAGLSRAIPVEHVLCVLEVKSTFSSKTAKDARGHLSKLRSLMGGFDKPEERYKRYLPERFTCGIVFFDILESEAHNERALRQIVLASVELRGFFGGTILRGEGHQAPLTAKLMLLNGRTPLPRLIKPGMMSLLLDNALGGHVRVRDDQHRGMTVSWLEMNFAQFGFDLIAIMQGTYKPFRASSWYGQGEPQLTHHQRVKSSPA